MLTVINGEGGRKVGGNVILSVVDALIHPSIQAEYTWTGKTNNSNTKKRRLDAFINIHSVVHSVCRLADSNYNQKDCTHDMIYKVLKYAQSRW